MALDSANFIASSIWGGSAMLLYSIILPVIYSSKLWKNSFFQLVFYQGLLHVFTYANSFITIRLPQNTCGDCVLSQFFDGNPLGGALTLFHAIHYHMAFVQYMSALVITINRFSTIYFPLLFDQMWKGRTPLYVNIAIILIPMSVTQQIIRGVSHYEYVPFMDWYAAKSTLDIRKFVSPLMVFVMLICTVVNAILNIYCSANLRKIPKRHGGTQKKLLIYTFFGFIVETFGSTVSLINVIVTEETTFKHYLQRYIPWFSDCLTFTPPFVLLFCSSAIRAEIAALFKIRASSVSPTTNQS